MARSYYPAFLDLEGQRVLVVGGGVVAESKAKALAKCGAKVTVVAPEIGRRLKRTAADCKRRPFEENDLEGVHLAVIATDDESLNIRAAAACRRRNVLHNVVDRPGLCAFICPSVARRGRLTLAVSTGGASPALARTLRQRLEKFLTPADAQLAAKLARMRPRLLKLPLTQRRRALAGMLEAG